MGAQEKIARLRELVRNAYNAIANKGGSVPEVGERNMENLSAAIESIVTSGLFSSLAEIGWMQEDVSALNEKRNADLEYSKSVAHIENHISDKNLIYAPYPANKKKLHKYLYGCTNIEYIPKIDCGEIPSTAENSLLFSGINGRRLVDIYLYNINRSLTNNYIDDYFFSNICYNSPMVKSLTMLGKLGFHIDVTSFYCCSNLTKIVLGDCSGMGKFSFLKYVSALVDFEVEKLPNISLVSAFSSNNKLSHDS